VNPTTVVGIVKNFDELSMLYKIEKHRHHKFVVLQSQENSILSICSVTLRNIIGKKVLLKLVSNRNKEIPLYHVELINSFNDRFNQHYLWYDCVHPLYVFFNVHLSNHKS